MDRPQPLGILPLPAGWLVLPGQVAADPELREAREALLAGMLPPSWPAAWRAIELAAAGDVAAAAAAVDPGSGPEHAYNHFVLTGEPASAARAEAGAVGDPGLAALVAVAGYSLGQGPAEGLPDPAGLDGEIAAHVLAAHAAAALEAGDHQRALDALVRAEHVAAPVSPVLAALLLGQQVSLLQEVRGADDEVVAGYREAITGLDGRDAVRTAAGELTLGLATAHQELAAAGAGPAALHEAVRAYHLALRSLRKEGHPERYAFAHSNLALCYLSLPMTEARDTLRRGVAVQSLREALTVYTRETYPREWASVTLNLANALQHLPTTHPVENLVEAVGMYEELLVARPVDADPLGHARVLANQGTALAHLGIHDQARAKLGAARELFAGAGDDGAAATVEEALAGVVATEQAAAEQAAEQEVVRGTA
ncbi:MAG TPA: hypothetical protein VI248_21560 [Kineosporiaceae bacterium]